MGWYTLGWVWTAASARDLRSKVLPIEDFDRLNGTGIFLTRIIAITRWKHTLFQKRGLGAPGWGEMGDGDWVGRSAKASGHGGELIHD